MAKPNPKFKFYLTDGDKSKTLSETHPKLDATSAQLGSAAQGLSDALSMDCNEITIASETTVYTAE